MRYSGYHPRANVIVEVGHEIAERFSYAWADLRIMFGAARNLDLPEGVRLNNEMLNWVRDIRAALDECSSMVEFDSLAYNFQRYKKKIPLVMAQRVWEWLASTRARIIEKAPA